MTKKDRSYRKSTVPENAKLVYEGKLFDTYQWEQKLYDGTTEIFEKIVRTDTAVIYPVLPDGRILLVKDSQPHRSVILTAPAGRLEDGETPQEAIERELLEETGYAAESVFSFYTYQPYEKFDWFVHVFIGKGCKKIADPKVDPGEQIELMPVTFDEMIRLTIDGALHQQGFTQVVLQAVADPTKMAELKKLFSA